MLSDGQEELLTAWSECRHVPPWWLVASTLSCHVASSLTPLLLCVGVGGGGGAEPVQGARRDTCHQHQHQPCQGRPPLEAPWAQAGEPSKLDTKTINKQRFAKAMIDF